MKKIFLYTLLTLLITISCSPDLGNYKYRDLIEPHITGIDSEMTVLTYSDLVIKPNLGLSNISDDDYSYEWKAINIDTNYDQRTYILSEEKDLNYNIDILPGNYLLVFTVTEKSTGIFWQAQSDLRVTQTTSEGWLALCNVNGETRLDMYSVITESLYTDLLKNSGLPSVMRGPRKIYRLKNNFSDTESPFYLLTDDGATRLSRSGFEWKEEYNFCYEMATGANIIPERIYESPAGKFMLDGRDTYFADCKTITGVYGVPVNKGFNAAPFVGVNIATENIIASVTLLFDTDTKKFYGYCPLMASDELNNQPVLHEMNDLTGVVNDMALAGIIEAGVVGNAFDKFPEGEDLVYLENTKYDPGNGYMGITYAVMSEGSNYKLYGIQMGDALTWYDCSYVIGKAYYGDLSSCTRIAEAEHFAFSSLMNCMYYSVGGTLYRVNLSAETLTSEVQFTHVGETITTLKFHMYRETANQNRSYDLIVASVKSDVGTLRIYEGYNSSGDFKNVKPEVYTGFGPIVDVIYREN